VSQVVEALQSVVAEWVGQPVEPTSVYGVRLYTRGATFEPHVDRVETHIASVIINVGQVSSLVMMMVLLLSL
jgi:prolyl 4-hydroxylase